MSENNIPEKYKILESARRFGMNGDFDSALKALDKCMSYDGMRDEVLLEKLKIFSCQGRSGQIIKEAAGTADTIQDIRILNNIKIFLAKAYIALNNLYEAKKVLDGIADSDFKDTESYCAERLNISFALYNDMFRISDFSGDAGELEREYCIIKKLKPYNLKHLFFIMRISNYFCDYKFTQELKDKYGYLVKKEDTFYGNLILNEYETAAGRTVLESKPRCMWIAVSSRCNLQCRMCRTNEQKWGLSDENIKEIYSYMPYLEHITWWGGEPTVSEKFYEMIEYSFQYKNIRHSVITNGQYMPDKFINLVKNNSVEVVFSVDSVKKDVYEKIRVNASFEKLEQNIKKLAEIYGHKFIKINVVLMDYNKDDIPEITAFAKKYGIKNISLIPLSGSRFTEHGVKKCDIDSVKEISDSYKKDIMIYNPVSKAENCFKAGNNTGDVCISICSVPWTSLVITYDGMLFPENLCAGFYGRGIPLKNIKIEEFWNGEYMSDLRKEMKEKHFCSVNCPKANIRYGNNK